MSSPDSLLAPGRREGILRYFNHASSITKKTKRQKSYGKNPATAESEVITPGQFMSIGDLL